MLFIIYKQSINGHAIKVLQNIKFFNRFKVFNELLFLSNIISKIVFFKSKENQAPNSLI